MPVTGSTGIKIVLVILCRAGANASSQSLILLFTEYISVDVCRDLMFSNYKHGAKSVIKS